MKTSRGPLYICDRTKCEHCNKECYLTKDILHELKYEYREPLNGMDIIDQLRFLADELLGMCDGKPGSTEFEKAKIMLTAANAIDQLRFLADELLGMCDGKPGSTEFEEAKIMPTAANALVYRQHYRKE